MPAVFVVEDGTVEIRFQWPGLEVAKAQEIVGYAARYDWLRGLGPTIEENGETVQKPWGDLTNQEKLNMVYRGAQRLIVAQAQTALVDSGVDAARQDALDYASENYILPET